MPLSLQNSLNATFIAKWKSRVVSIDPNRYNFCTTYISDWMSLKPNNNLFFIVASWTYLISKTWQSYQSTGWRCNNHICWPGQLNHNNSADDYIYKLIPALISKVFQFTPGVYVAIIKIPILQACFDEHNIYAYIITFILHICNDTKYCNITPL